MLPQKDIRLWQWSIPWKYKLGSGNSKIKFRTVLWQIFIKSKPKQKIFCVYLFSILICFKDSLHRSCLVNRIFTIYSPQNCLVSLWVCTTLPFSATDIVLGKEAPDWLCALVLSTASWSFPVFLPIVGTWSIASTTWPESGFQSNFLTTASGCQSMFYKVFLNLCY